MSDSICASAPVVSAVFLTDCNEIIRRLHLSDDGQISLVEGGR